MPIALNSGLFWPRRSILRLPGTVLVEILDPIAPGLDKDVFFERLQDTIESGDRALDRRSQKQGGVLNHLAQAVVVSCAPLSRSASRRKSSSR